MYESKTRWKYNLSVFLYPSFSLPPIYMGDSTKRTLWMRRTWQQQTATSVHDVDGTEHAKFVLRLHMMQTWATQRDSACAECWSTVKTSPYRNAGPQYFERSNVGQAQQLTWIPLRILIWWPIDRGALGLSSCIRVANAECRQRA